MKHHFAFSGLLQCGHCGCDLSARLRSGGICTTTAPGTKAAVQSRMFGTKCSRSGHGASRTASVDEVMDWVREALRHSHADEKRHRDEAIDRLRAEYGRLQAGGGHLRRQARWSVDAAFFDRMANEWRGQQSRCSPTSSDTRRPTRAIWTKVRSLELAQNA